MDGMTEISMDGKEAGADGVEREGGRKRYGSYPYSHTDGYLALDRTRLVGSAADWFFLSLTVQEPGIVCSFSIGRSTGVLLFYYY